MRARILLLIGLLSACSTSDKPDNLIPEDKMIRLLEEVHIAENQVNNLHMGSADSSLVVYKGLEKEIFKKYGVDTAIYRASFKYYVARPEQFKTMYTKVVKDLEVQNERYLKKQRASKPDTTKKPI
ncbi:DUF4296 domain-containing protein [Flectobacillus sp. DC10W]|uniref:DUF4296 domain-containing protein n=1 Tax=Flectobacillus longus TaxID=2984207 RepID=A0ABT6YT19_9BACT|nr:DUF4296 domain-containing protein [Flectobacillus longus]MDI9866291.1 DUF4296 domain-containing protein [Flectobacillus longus]